MKVMLPVMVERPGSLAPTLANLGLGLIHDRLGNTLMVTQAFGDGSAFGRGLGLLRS